MQWLLSFKQNKTIKAQDTVMIRTHIRYKCDVDSDAANHKRQQITANTQNTL